MVLLLLFVIACAGGGPLVLQGSKAGLHTEEQEEGDERPDLDCSLTVTARKSLAQDA